jgi:dienelactone hydrolase
MFNTVAARDTCTMTCVKWMVSLILLLAHLALAVDDTRVPATTRPAAGWPCVVFVARGDLPAAQEEIVDDLVDRGFAVMVRRLDTTMPAEAAAGEVLRWRRELTSTTQTTQLKLDPDRLFILPAGYRLITDIEFARDGDRVLCLDLAYPASATQPAPVVVEFSCDNQNRMGSGSLLFCHDALLEVAALRGYAIAMADHPVRPPYKGIDDPMPEVLDRARAAIEVVRARSGELPISRQVAAVGFSRGGPFAAMLAARGDVDVALVHGNRYNYSRLALDDPMWARFTNAWGVFELHKQRWLVHGAVHHLTDRCAPMFLSTSAAESAEYRAGLAHLRDALRERGVQHVYREDDDARGHRVTTDPARLKEIFDFFDQHLR